jgi:hypothetical protein
VKKDKHKSYRQIAQDDAKQNHEIHDGYLNAEKITQRNS